MTRRLLKAAPFCALALTLIACGGQSGTTTTSTSQPEVEAEMTNVRFVNVVVDSPAIEGYVGEWEVGGDLSHGQWANWTEVPAGEWDVTLRHGEAINLTDTYDFRAGEHYWIIAWGALNPRGTENAATFLIAPEEDLDATGEDTWLRFANAVADGEAYGLLVTTDGSVTGLFPNQPIGTISEWKRGPIYENTFDIIPARDTSLDPVHSFEHNMQVGLLYTAILTGRVSNGDLEVIMIAEEGSR